jgi:hypothetical protein
LKKRLAGVSPNQLGYLLSIVPLYQSARALKNSIWPGGGLDPSGHALFKVAQYGMMISTATAHGSRGKLRPAVVSYLSLMAVADSVMLANTFTNCHTLTEVLVGVVLGLAVLLAAALIGELTPLGSLAKELGLVAIGGSEARTISGGATLPRYRPSRRQ